MKLKIPQKVLLSGKSWRVVANKKEGGGWFNGEKATISIGTKYHQDIEDVYVHEILEAILVERKHRYQLSRGRCDNGDLFFAFDHKDFENICADLACALFHKDNTKIRKRNRKCNSNKKPVNSANNPPNKSVFSKLGLTKEHK